MNRKFIPVDISGKLADFITYKQYVKNAFDYNDEPNLNAVIETAMEVSQNYRNFVYDNVWEDGTCYVVFSKNEFTREEGLTYVKIQKGDYALDINVNTSEQEMINQIDDEKARIRKEKEDETEKQICCSCVPRFQHILYQAYEGNGVLNTLMETKEDVHRMLNEYPKLKVFFFSFAYASDEVINEIRSLKSPVKIVLVSDAHSLTNDVKSLYHDLVDEFLEIDETMLEKIR